MIYRSSFIRHCVHLKVRGLVIRWWESVTSLMGGPNLMIQKCNVYITWWSKNVMWRTGRSNWPPWWSKNVTWRTGGSNWNPWWSKNVPWWTGGSNWPFRCLDIFNSAYQGLDDLCQKLVNISITMLSKAWTQRWRTWSPASERSASYRTLLSGIGIGTRLGKNKHSAIVVLHKI